MGHNTYFGRRKSNREKPIQGPFQIFEGNFCYHRHNSELLYEKLPNFLSVKASLATRITDHIFCILFSKVISKIDILCKNIYS